MTNSSTLSRDLLIILQNDNFFDERCAYKMESNFFTFSSYPRRTKRPSQQQQTENERAIVEGGVKVGRPAK